MPKKADKKIKKKRAALNKRWAKEGRTANQHKKWLEKEGDKPKNPFGRR